MKKLTNASIIFLIVLSAFSCRKKIDSANYGLRIDQYGDNKGKVVELVSGAVWYAPWSYDIEEVPGFVQHVEYAEFSITAAGGSVCTLSPILNYRVQEERVTVMYKKYRQNLDELERGVIKTIVKEAYRTVLNSYTIDSLMNSRARFEKQVFDTLSKKLNSEGFDVEQLTSGLTPPESITKAIDDKNKAIQEAMTIDNEVKSTEAEARKKVVKANGDAEALLIGARAEAESNRLRQQSLTPLLMQQQFIEKWNGELPTYGQVPSLFKSIQ
jgi:regulator of protease activity HflC (stomatin/prohibitin superfamily)